MGLLMFSSTIRSIVDGSKHTFLPFIITERLSDATGINGLECGSVTENPDSLITCRLPPKEVTK